MSERMPDYAQGFKDGFAAGLEEGKKLAPKDAVFRPGILGLPNTCQVCGRLQSGIQGYVCYDPKCPTRVTAAYSTGPVGSVMMDGKMTGDFTNIQGYNSHPNDPNSIWVNGQGYELGN